MGYKKSDVKTSYHNGHQGDPMVNVKVNGRWDMDLAKITAIAADNGYGADAAQFVLELLDDDQRSSDLFALACESGWEMLETDARELFGSHVKVWSAGRSGGWAVVQGLRDVESWDAVALAKWRRFERWATDAASGIPYDMVVTALINDWEWEADERKAAAAERAENERIAAIAFAFAV